MTFEWLGEQGHCTSPQGFRAGVAQCAIKKAGRDDLALLISDRPCRAASIFTTNVVKAAPVRYDQALLKANATAIRGVIINSGNANACTGEAGDHAALTMAQETEKALDLPAASVFVMSTGTIGVPMPMEKISPGILAASKELLPENGLRIAHAIMTTDTRPKHCAARVTLPNGGVCTIGGMAKGAGMIHPNMATMLSVITTDAAISPLALDRLLRWVADRSFHSISVDGDTSTNDTLLLLANGASGVTLQDSDLDPLAPTPAGKDFIDALLRVAIHLAQAVVRDGEGATRFVTIQIQGAPNDAAARQAALSVARSPLVKTALFGADPNWGRVLCALGYSGVNFDSDSVRLEMNGMLLLEDGLPLPLDEAEATRKLQVPEIEIRADLRNGTGVATVWTCDFSDKYIEINAAYRT